MVKIKVLSMSMFISLAAANATYAQYPCSQGFGNPYNSGYGSGYGYSPYPHHGTMDGFSSRSSYFGPSSFTPGLYQSPPNFFPPPAYNAPVGLPYQNYYSNNVNYGNPNHDHDHHPWHLGHYLLGHH